MRDDGFVQTQREYSERASPEHFVWQTSAPYFAATEAQLLRGVRLGAGERLLEMGCGEGGNLHHLSRHGGLCVGVDFSPEKAAFARRESGAEAAVADVARLPFADETFDVVLIRDLLHHLPDRARALAEARRVLKSGGRLTVIEPNIRSPLVLLQAALTPAERGVWLSTDERLRAELAEAGFALEDAEALQPLPLGRVVLNPRLGASHLGRRPSVARVLDSIDQLAERLLPRSAWMYLSYQAVRP